MLCACYRHRHGVCYLYGPVIRDLQPDQYYLDALPYFGSNEQHSSHFCQPVPCYQHSFFLFFFKDYFEHCCALHHSHHCCTLH
jgi:hypothetical protein